MENLQSQIFVLQEVRSNQTQNYTECILKYKLHKTFSTVM